jgi:L-alanine-DL-glutamate epimerase-like enolase superfamily enzyme
LNTLLKAIIPVAAAFKCAIVTMVAVPISSHLLIGIVESLEMVYVVDHPSVVHYNDVIAYNHVSITSR